MCQSLSQIKSLDSLTFDIIADYVYSKSTPIAYKERILKSALEPLENLKARVFEVEVNLMVTQSFLDSLGDVNFTVKVRKRDLNNELFPYGMVLCQLESGEAL